CKKKNKRNSTNSIRSNPNEVPTSDPKEISNILNKYFATSKEHAVPFFLKSNCLPLPSIFFRDCSYLLYDINRQTAPVSILNQFVKTSQIHNYRTRSVSSDSFYVKFSRTDKMYAFFTRIGAQIWNSIPYSIKILKRSSFRKKIKELLLNFLRSEDDYVEVSRLIKLFNTLVNLSS
ncbi:unnamed protein product, partial [Porites lobata]